MKKFVIHILLFSSILIIVFTLLNTLPAYHRYEAPQYKTQYGELLGTSRKHQDINGIIIGTSQTAYSLRPTVLDQTQVSYYNFGYGRGNPEFYLKWYDEFFTEHYPKVQYGIISVDRFFLQNRNGRVFEQDSEYLPESTVLDLLGNENIDNSSLIAHRFPAFKYRKKLLSTLVPKRQTTPFDMNDFDRGFLSYNLPYSVKSFRRKTGSTFSVSSKAKDDFNLLIDKLFSSGMELYFVMPPEYNVTPDQYREIRAYMQTLSAKYDIPFFNFNDEYRLDAFENTENYSDPSHLNRKGSLIFSQALADAINQYKKAQKDPSSPGFP